MKNSENFNNTNSNRYIKIGSWILTTIWQKVVKVVLELLANVNTLIDIINYE